MPKEQCQARIQITEAPFIGKNTVTAYMSCGNCNLGTNLEPQTAETLTGATRAMKGEALTLLSQRWCRPWTRKSKQTGSGKWRLMTNDFAPSALKLDQPNPKPSP